MFVLFGISDEPMHLNFSIWIHPFHTRRQNILNLSCLFATSLCICKLTLGAEHLLPLRLGGRVDPGPSLEFRHELEALHAGHEHRRRCANGDEGRDQRDSVGWRCFHFAHTGMVARDDMPYPPLRFWWVGSVWGDGCSTRRQHFGRFRFRSSCPLWKDHN